MAKLTLPDFRPRVAAIRGMAPRDPEAAKANTQTAEAFRIAHDALDLLVSSVNELRVAIGVSAGGSGAASEDEVVAIDDIPVTY